MNKWFNEQMVQYSMFNVQCTERMVIEIQLKTKEMHKKVKQATVTVLGASKIKMTTACLTKER